MDPQSSSQGCSGRMRCWPPATSRFAAAPPRCLAPHPWGEVAAYATRGERKPPGEPLSWKKGEPGRSVLQLHWEHLRKRFSDCSRTLIFPQDALPPFYPCHAHWPARYRCQSTEALPTLNSSAEPHLPAGSDYWLLPMPTNAFLPG